MYERFPGFTYRIQASFHSCYGSRVESSWTFPCSFAFIVVVAVVLVRTTTSITTTPSTQRSIDTVGAEGVYLWFQRNKSAPVFGWDYMFLGLVPKP